MNKNIILVFAVLLLVPFCMAEYKQLQKSFTVELENNMLYVNGSGVSYERDTQCSGNTTSGFSKELTLTWYENITCSIESDMSAIREQVKNLSECLSQVQVNTDKYYPLYASCTLNLSECEAYRKANDEYKAKSESLQSSLNGMQSQVTSASSQLSECTKNLEDNKIKLGDANGRNWLFGIAAVGAGIVAFVMWRKYKRPHDKASEQPHDDQSGYFEQ